MHLPKPFTSYTPPVSNVDIGVLGQEVTDPLIAEEIAAGLGNNDLKYGSISSRNDEEPDHDAQEGVQRAEAITLVWSKRSLIWTYAFILLVHTVNSLQQQVTGNLTAYVVSDFSAHSLIPVIGIVSGIMSGVLRLPIAKMLDLWGRAEGFAVMTVIATLGLALMAACRNIETYAAAQVFYHVGFNGMSYVLEIVVVDTSSLKNRALAFAFSSSPYIITTFAGPAIAQWFYHNTGFRWAFASFVIITPLVSIPIFAILYINQEKAKRIGVLPREYVDRNVTQNIWHYAREFDAVGVSLLSMGLVLFLLPFSLAGYESNEWKSASTISMIILGFLLLAIFFTWESLFAVKPFIPYKLLLSPTIIGACLLSATLFVAFFCWDGYFTSYLQVVNGLSIQEAGYIANIYSIVSCIFAIVVGFLIRISGRFKWLALVAVPVQILGGGLMIHFRQPDTHVVFIVLCQVLIACAGGTMVICEQMAVMAVAEHGEVAAILALEGLFASIGGAVGSSVSGAIWNNTLPGALYSRLPGSAKHNAKAIYEDLALQLSYPIGSPIRQAIIEAYAIAQKRMCIAGTAVLFSGFFWVGIWRDVKVSELRQTKGRVL